MLRTVQTSSNLAVSAFPVRANFLGFVVATGFLHLAGIGMGIGIARLDAMRARWITQIGGVAIAAAGVSLLATMS
jgi:hydrogenase/urease accessory protein HupE